MLRYHIAIEHVPGIPKSGNISTLTLWVLNEDVAWDIGRTVAAKLGPSARVVMVKEWKGGMNDLQRD